MVKRTHDGVVKRDLLTCCAMLPYDLWVLVLEYYLCCEVCARGVDLTKLPMRISARIGCRYAVPKLQVMRRDMKKVYNHYAIFCCKFCFDPMQCPELRTICGLNSLCIRESSVQRLRAWLDHYEEKENERNDDAVAVFWIDTLFGKWYKNNDPEW